VSNILISFAIPTYNNEKTIEQAILSCLNQETSTEYEILIVNNASTDKTADVIAKYQDNEKIRVVTNNETVTLFENHNLCLEHAIGKYLVYCHSDDTVEDHLIERFSQKLKERNYPKKYVLWGRSMFRDYAGHYVKKAGFSLNVMVAGEYAPLGFIYGGLTPSGTCFSRESFLALGGYMKTTHKVAPADMTTMIYLAMQGFRFEMIDELVFKREFASNALAGNLETYLEEVDDAYKHFIDLVDNESIGKLIALASGQKSSPYYLYYALAQDTAFRPQIKKYLISHILRKPWYLKSPIVHKLIKRLYL